MPEHQVTRDRKDTKVMPEHQVTRDRKDTKVMQEHQVTKVTKGSKATRVYKDSKASKVIRVTKVHKEILDQTDQMDHKASKVTQAHLCLLRLSTQDLISIIKLPHYQLAPQQHLIVF